MVYDNQNQRLFVIQQINKSPRLFQYSFISDSWIEYKIHSVSNHAFWCSWYDPAAINNDGNTIYLCGKEGEITIFELKNNNECEMKIIKDLNEIQGGVTFGAGIIIKDEFHTIGGLVTN